ncbi:MAG TPA: hypothetical protein VJQ25_11670, partial [Nitrospira sp.]|nr:hypothetical protein [Nitrospira sp.]
SRLASFSKKMMGPEFSNRHEGMIIRGDRLLRIRARLILESVYRYHGCVEEMVLNRLANQSALTTPIVEWMDNGRPFRTMTPTYDS